MAGSRDAVGEDLFAEDRRLVLRCSRLGDLRGGSRAVPGTQEGGGESQDRRPELPNGYARGMPQGSLRCGGGRLGEGPQQASGDAQDSQDSPRNDAQEVAQKRVNKYIGNLCFFLFVFTRIIRDYPSSHSIHIRRLMLLPLVVLLLHFSILVQLLAICCFGNKEPEVHSLLSYN